MSQKQGEQSQDKLAKYLLVTYAMRRSSYMVRGIAGGYLVYLMYQMFQGSSGSEEPLTLPMIAAGVFMIVAGIYFVLGAGYALLKGIYSENDPEVLQEMQAAESDEKVVDEE